MKKFFKELFDFRSVRSDLLVVIIIAVWGGGAWVWASLEGLLPFVWRSLMGFYPVPGWLLILFLTGVTGALLGLFRLYWPPDHVRLYRKDRLDLLAWEWNYDRNYKIINAIPLCLECGTEVTLIPVVSATLSSGAAWGDTQIYCPTCNTTKGIKNTLRIKEDHALPKIRQRIRTGDWKKSLKDRVDGNI